MVVEEEEEMAGGRERKGWQHGNSKLSQTDKQSDHVAGPLIGDASRCTRVEPASKPGSCLFQTVALRNLHSNVREYTIAIITTLR